MLHRQPGEGKVNKDCFKGKEQTKKYQNVKVITNIL